MGIKTLMIPKNHEYINRLKASLEKIDVEVMILKPFHYSTFTNIAKILFFRARGCRLIHVHWLYIFPLGFVMKWFSYFCRGLGIKVVWEMHNILPHNYSESDKKSSRWFYEKADGVIFHSASDIQRAKETYGTGVDKNHIVIPHGNFNESYANTISKGEARRRLNIPDGKRVILCFGFLRKNRGYEYLMESTRGMPDTIVIIAGEMMEKDVYDTLAGYEREVPNLRLFVKWIPNEELQVYFNASDIVVLPYTDITTSGVIPLAYAFSRPVVTTNIGGLTEVVNENTGILVPPRDSEELKKAIERLFAMDFESMGRYAREHAEREFSWERNALKIKKFYESMVCGNEGFINEPPLGLKPQGFQNVKNKSKNQKR